MLTEMTMHRHRLALRSALASLGLFLIAAARPILLPAQAPEPPSPTVAPAPAAYGAGTGTAEAPVPRGITAFFCGCRSCRVAARALDRVARKPGALLVTAVYGGKPEQARQFASETGVRFPVLPDPVGRLHLRWSVDHCPTLFAVANGKITAQESPGGSADVPAAVQRLQQTLSGPAQR